MLFKKKYKIKQMGSSFDRLVNYNLSSDLDISDQMIELADAILANCPVLINFDTMEDLDSSNRVLSFLSGLIYAIGGKSFQIGKELYLIASDEAFNDGSLDKWIKEFQERK